MRLPEWQVTSPVSLLFSRTTGSIILHVAYGYEVVEGPDPMLKSAQASISLSSVVVTPGAWLVDTFPICMYFYAYVWISLIILLVVKHLPVWFPGASFRRFALYVKNQNIERRTLTEGWVREQMVCTTGSSHFECF